MSHRSGPDDTCFESVTYIIPHGLVFGMRKRKQASPGRKSARKQINGTFRGPMGGE